ncbi:toll-like receptor 5 [Stigmatopora argus]
MVKIFTFLVVLILIFQVPDCLSSCSLFGSVADCSFRKLYRIPSLPPNITHLYLESNRISEINPTSLSGLEMLQELDLGHQYSSLVIRNYAFRRQRHLKKLVLGFNTRLTLEPQAFFGLSNLENLQLDHCDLQDSILKDDYLKPLSLLKTLNLFGNQIKTLRLSVFFSNLTHLKDLNLKLNRINKIGDPDLSALQGKRIEFLNLDSNNLQAMYDQHLDQNAHGNPFRGISFGTLDLSNNGLSIEKLTLFFKAIAGTKISHLKLSGHIGKGFSFNNFQDVNRSTFEGLRTSSIRTLDLSKNMLFALHQGAFDPLTEAKDLDLSQNQINQIHNGAFAGQENLTKLNLSNNLLGEIHTHSFTPLKNLQVLDLSYNHIGILGYMAFSGLFSLEVLNLKGNSLRKFGFPSAAFKLTYLNLYDNKLTFSSVERITEFAPNVTYLNIQNNRIENLHAAHTFITQLEKLQYLFFGGNPIRWCTLNENSSKKKQSGIKVLDFHSSNLQSIWSQGKCLDIFQGLHHLVTLSLNSNNLNSLPKGIFKGLTSLLEMDLSSNTLTYLQNDTFPQNLKILNLANNFIASPDPAPFRTLNVLNFMNNRFHCNSDLKIFLMWIQDTNVTFSSPAEEFRCEFPFSLYKIPLGNYSIQLLGNGST